MLGFFLGLQWPLSGRIAEGKGLCFDFRGRVRCSGSPPNVDVGGMGDGGAICAWSLPSGEPRQVGWLPCSVFWLVSWSGSVARGCRLVFWTDDLQHVRCEPQDCPVACEWSWQGATRWLEIL
ncbi:hypothetical protein GUJ93_ZPchr0011g28277 [Zizania palustris]|uniref:Uncharacterized protein n=1 Tax=Zizania palustris TaxID=103762 RepID=A0A8J5WLY2_ZIZPA|nr:hypothetical protein GUJ93_ZPchr0011g28277 [Zizania palustris]